MIYDANQIDRDIRTLKERIRDLELQVDNQGILIRDFFDEREQYRKELAKHGQANPQDRERSQERTKGHKKASENG
jgi:SMC interacting uncharacterized protein involved in chromosome segregation